MSDWKPIETLTSSFWVYVPGYAVEPALPEGKPVVRATFQSQHNILVSESGYALVKQHAPTHWLPSDADPDSFELPRPSTARVSARDEPRIDPDRELPSEVRKEP